MPHALITKTFRFEAAHQLPNHRGKCARPHGHSYVVDVDVYGPVQPIPGSDEGMVLDFDVLSTAWKTIIESQFDHRDLNERFEANGWNGPTTAENIAGVLLRLFHEECGDRVVGVTVWETATSRAKVCAGDGWLS